MNQEDIEDPSEIFEKEMIYEEILNEQERFFEGLSSRVKDSLLFLSSAERSIFLLRSIEGLSYKEIADTLNIPMGTVMSHLSRARVKLRKSLCEYVKEMRIGRYK